MSEKSNPEIILEAIKIFLWPIVILTVIFWFGNDLRDILKNRSFKIGLVEVGDRISTLESSVQGELISQGDYFDQILENANDAEKVREIASIALQDNKNAKLEINKKINNITNVVPEITRTTPEQIKLAPSQGLTAQDWEEKGLQALLARDINEVIHAFTESEKITPDLHNVSEIRRLLRKNQESLKDSDSDNWKMVYKEILSKYVWGLPLHYKQQMENYIQN
jgi:hypothetical protein